jgi:hypothetical protein
VLHHAPGAAMIRNSNVVKIFGGEIDHSGQPSGPSALVPARRPWGERPSPL